MNDECRLKTHDILLMVLIATFSLFGMLAFFFTPKDASIAMKVVEVVGISISDVLAFKFGIHQAQVQPGTVQVTKTVNPPDPKPADAQPIADNPADPHP